MTIIGESPINPILFITAKFAGYFLWILVILDFFGYYLYYPLLSFPMFAYLVFALGLGISIESVVVLGKSTSLGLPNEKTHFIAKGLYAYSRNPMYLGFHLMTLAGIIVSMHPITVLLGAYCIGVYHLIIKAEEEFLEKRFKDEFKTYKKKVRRYL